MIFNHRAVSLAFFGSLALSSDSTIGGSSNVLVSAVPWPWGASTGRDNIAPSDVPPLPTHAPVVPPLTDEITTKAAGLPTDFCYNENGAKVCIYYNDDLTCSMKLNGRSFRTTLSASICASLAAPHSSDPSTGSQPSKTPSLRPSASPIVPQTDEITTSAVGLPKDFCYNENGAEVCIYYYDDLKCDVMLNGRSFRTGISASFCASLAAPYSSDPSTGIQPTKSPSSQPTKSPSSRPTKSPSSRPTKSPSSRPTEAPTRSPTTAAPSASSPTESPAPCFDGTDRNGGGNGHAFYYLPSGGGVVPSTDCAADFALEHRSGHDDFVEACGRPLVLDGRAAGAVRDVCRFTCGVCGDNGAPTTKAPTAAPSVRPTKSPSSQPVQPTKSPSSQPTKSPSSQPTAKPSVDPFNAALKAAEEAQKEADAQKAAEEAQKAAEKAAKTAQKAAEKAQKAVEKAQKEAEKAVEKAQKEAEKAQQEAQKEAEEAAKNEYKEDTGVMLEEEEMVFLSLMYNRGDVETDSEIASLSVRQGRGRRRAHAIRRRATATKKRRETMAK